jgi:hypothetical protein
MSKHKLDKINNILTAEIAENAEGGKNLKSPRRARKNKNLDRITGWTG